MITDPRVFDDTYLPRELPHREGEIEELSTGFGPTLAGQASEEILLSGPSGVGKTALARHTLDRLEARGDVTSAYVSCLGTTPAGILRSVLKYLPSTDDPSVTTPVETLHERLTDAVDHPVIVILDEADGLPDSEALSLLGDIDLLSTVVITHNPQEWLARTTTESDRYIGARKITLDRYLVDELADILEARADIGLAGDVIDRGQLEHIADEVAGVARYGIQSLRAAAELADEREHERVGAVDVADAFERARHRIRESNLRSLPFHHHVLYAIIHEAREISAGELHDRYERSEAVYRGQDLMPIGRRSRRNKLAKLQEYDLVVAEGPAQDRVYRVTDSRIGSPIGFECIVI
jgi:Cdc6-like AAA superfamily ATPase